MIPARAIDLTRRYGDVVALDRLNLDVPAGQLLGLLGPNGAGKSTLVSVLTGVRRPTSGTAELCGGDPSRARRLGPRTRIPEWMGSPRGRRPTHPRRARSGP